MSGEGTDQNDNFSGKLAAVMQVRDKIVCRSRLGGMLNFYVREAA
jgi:hypothetical protein